MRKKKKHWTLTSGFQTHLHTYSVNRTLNYQGDSSMNSK